MCCTLREARLTDTILYAGEAIHPDTGAYVHVLGYQNRAQNLAGGPNAMLLPFPTDVQMGPDNVVSLDLYRGVLADYAERVRPRGLSVYSRVAAGRAGGPPVQVFASGSYTVLLAQRAIFLPSALGCVPEGRRPAFNADVATAIDTLYSGCPVALCCFDEAAIDAEPMLWWYVPRDPTRLFAPALDAHDGLAPRLDERVVVDHHVVFGSTITPRGARVQLSSPPRGLAAELLPDRVFGQKVDGTAPNGDFGAAVRQFADAPVTGTQRFVFERALPSGAAIHDWRWSDTTHG